MAPYMGKEISIYTKTQDVLTKVCPPGKLKLATNVNSTSGKRISECATICVVSGLTPEGEYATTVFEQIPPDKDNPEAKPMLSPLFAMTHKNMPPSAQAYFNLLKLRLSNLTPKVRVVVIEDTVRDVEWEIKSKE